MLDVITGGRLISRMVRGIGSEYFSFGANPVHSLERHQEAHDLVVQSMDRARSVRIRRQALSLRIRERVAAAVPAAASADLGVRRLGCAETHRMGRAPSTQIRLSAGLQPGGSGRALPQLLSRAARSGVTATRRRPIGSAGRPRSTSPRPTRRRWTRRASTSRRCSMYSCPSNRS